MADTPNTVTSSAAIGSGTVFGTRTDTTTSSEIPISILAIPSDGTASGTHDFVDAANPLSVTLDSTVVTVDLGANNDVTLATLPDTAAGDLAAMVVDLAAIEVLLTTIDADTSKIQAPGQALMTASSPVVLASDHSDVKITLDGESVAVTGTFFQATQPVSAASLPLPSGAATSALQTSSEAILTTIDADTGTIAGDTTSIDGKITACDTGAVVVASGTLTNLSQLGGVAVSLNTGVRDAGTQRVTIATDDVVPVTGTFFQATQPISAASLPLPTSAATETTLDAIKTAVEGTLTVTGGGGGVEYTEDTAAATNPVGTATILVRSDTPAGQTTTDGDNVAQRGTDYGAAYVQIVDSSGSYVDSFGGGTQYAVDDPLGATPTGSLSVAIRDDALSTLTPVEGDAVGMRVDANGALWVIPSGTVTVDGSGVTQPISAASLPLPTGAATETTLDAINTKLATYTTADLDLGTDTSTVTITGIALPGAGGPVIGGTASDPIFVAQTTSPLPTGAATETTLGTLATETTLSSVNSALSDVATQTTLANCESSLSTLASTDFASETTLSTASSTLTTISGAVATETTLSSAYTTLGNIDSNTSGLSNAQQTIGVTDVLNVAVFDAANSQITDFATETTLSSVDGTLTTISGNITACNTGAVVISSGTVTANLSATDNAVLDTIDAVLDTINAKLVAGTVIGDVALPAATTGGATPGKLISAATTNATSVKASAGTVYALTAMKATAGQLHGWFLHNKAATTIYVKFYNATVATVVVGTTTPVMTLGMPAGASANVELQTGIEFTTAITVAATTGVADADTGAPAANDIVGCILYK